MKLSDIAVVGFDLDQTLYPKSPAIDQAIQAYIYERIAEHLHCSINEAKKLFTDLYQAGAGLSGSQSLAQLGIPNSKEIVQEALERADISAFLAPNAATLALLRAIKDKYRAIDLITGSTRKIMEAKLSQMKIPLATFDHVVSGEISKADGTAFQDWLRIHHNHRPEQLVYIGDREKTDFTIPNALGIRCILVNISRPNPNIDCPQLKKLDDISDYLL